MNKRVAVCGLFLALAFCRPVAAFSLGQLSFYVVNESLLQYNLLAEKSLQYYELLSISSSVKNWSLGLTLRANNFYQQAVNTTLETGQFQIFRSFLQYSSSRWRLSLGHFYALLGRGLVLSVLKNEDVLRERSVLGADLAWNRNRLRVRVLGGLLEDETEEQTWRLVAGEVSWNYLKRNRLGIHFSAVDDMESRRMLGSRYTGSISLSGNRLFENISYYAEIAALRFTDTRAENGYGMYGNLTYSGARLTGMFEYKRYWNMDNEINNPPIADREDEVAPIQDTEGVRAHLRYALGNPDITLFCNWGQYREYNDRGPHVYGGINAEDLWERVSLTLSYGIRDIIYPIRKLSGRLVLEMGGRMSLEISAEDKRYSDNDFRFNEQDHQVQVSYAPGASFFFMHQYSYNRIADLNHFYSAGFRLALRGDLVVQLVLGTMRGGQVCSGGQCLVLPPFKGVKFSLYKVFR